MATGYRRTMIASEKIEAWARFVRVAQAVQASVEADVKAAGFPPVAWYDALLELSRDGATGLRPFELGQRLLVAQYNLSRLIDRIERAGLVERRACPEDGRGQIIAITDSGLELLDDMWPVYRDAIAERFGGHLSDGDTKRLNALLERIRPEDPSRLALG